MEHKILVTYATRTGSTAGVAEAIAKTLTNAGFQVDLYPMQAVNKLSDYAAVVVGSPIQAQQWLPEAMQFLQTHRATLAQKPIATFTLCITLAMKDGEKYRSNIKTWLIPVRQIAKPQSEGIFAGVLNISKVPAFGERLKFRLSVLFGVWSEGDHRDWDAIQAWVEALPQKLALV